MNKLTIPSNYDKLTRDQRRLVRERYCKIQNDLCCHCGELLDGPPRKDIQEAFLNLKLFPDGFLDRPIHLHHNHDTGMTIGAVHARCNAVLWQYHGE